MSVVVIYMIVEAQTLEEFFLRCDVVLDHDYIPLCAPTYDGKTHTFVQPYKKEER